MIQKSRATNQLVPILLFFVLIIAAGLRFYDLNWDGGIFAHPDERSTVAFYAPTITWPENLADLLNPRTSTLNPFWNVDQQERRSYTYGHFPLYVLVLVAHLLNKLAPLSLSLPGAPPEWTQFLATSLSGQGFALIGRALAALADLASVYLIFLLGRRLYGAWGGLLAAALSAFTVLQIQLAHFFAVDPISTTFTLLALYGAVLLYDRQSVGAAWVTGLGIGLAVASKFSALPVVFAPIVAGYLIIHRQKSARAEEPPASLSRVAGLVILALGISFFVFALTSPYVLLDFENFKQAVIEEQGNMVSGVADFPFTRQYRRTTAYWYFIEQQLHWGMGWPLGLLALTGTLWVAVKAVLGKAQAGELICLTWVILYFGATGLFLAKFMRYMIPVVPLFTLFGAGLVVALWQWRGKPRQGVEPAPPQALGERWAYGELADVEPAQPPALAAFPVAQPSLLSRLTKPVAVSLAAIALLGSAIWAFAFVNGVYGSEHSWLTFSRWIYENVPDGSCLAYEHWDDRLPTSLPEPGGSPEAHYFRQPQLEMYNEDTQAKYEQIRATLYNCDYIVLATNRLWRTIPRLPERYPMSSRYYEALFSGELGYEIVYTAETPPRLGPLVFDTQPADESFTVYDHPKPILFKKTRQLSLAEWDALLGNTWQGAIPGYVGPPTLLMRLRGAGGQSAPPPAAPAESDKTLLLETPVEQLPVVDDYRWNSLANSSTVVAILVWWLAVMALGLAAFPLTFGLFHRLPDRGYGLSKSLGLLLVSYFVWLNSSLGWLENRFFTIVIAFGLLAGLAFWITLRQWQRLSEFWREGRGLVLVTEIIFSLVFLFFVYLRLLNPDLWQPWLGGEKMLEIGFLNAVVKSAQMPPYDPFFAGGIINYYYYGLFLVGILVKLTGIQPSIAFNLAVPTLAAFTAINAFSLAGNLALIGGPTLSKASLIKMLPAGLLALLFIVFIGNLEGSAQFMRNLAQVSLTDIETTIPGLGTLVPAIFGLVQVFQGNALATYNYWDPTRVIPSTINEFPYFSFLFADLHPHMIGIPITLLVLSLVYNRLLAAQEPAGRPENPPSFSAPVLFSRVLGYDWLRWLALPFVLGAIAIINTWDLPTYLGLIVAAYLLGLYRQSQGRLTWGLAGLSLVKTVLFTGMLLALTYLLYAPFFLNYHALDVGFGLVHTKTPLDQHLKIWGFFLFVIISWLWISLLYPHSHNSLLRAVSLMLRRWSVLPHLTEIYRRLVKRESDTYQLGLWGISLVFIITTLLFLLGYRVPAYLLPLVFISLLLLFRYEVPAATAYLSLLAFTGLLVLLGVEFFFLRDWLGGGDWYRMNTLFKFFIQVWVMFGLVAGVALPQFWEQAKHWFLPVRLIWWTVVTLLLLGTLIYPIFGTRTRVDDRFPGQANQPSIGTLDGLAYMTVGTFEWPAGHPIQLPYDYEAIRWLQDNVEGTPIIAEAKVGYYREGGMRVAAYTGLPSVLGSLHQNEQRYGSQISERELPVNEFWNTPDPGRALALMDQLGVRYVYVGQIERITHGDHVGDKFEQLRQQGELELVFENDQTKIYRRVTDAPTSS